VIEGVPVVLAVWEGVIVRLRVPVCVAVVEVDAVLLGVVDAVVVRVHGGVFVLLLVTVPDTVAVCVGEAVLLVVGGLLAVWVAVVVIEEVTVREAVPVRVAVPV